MGSDFLVEHFSKSAEKRDVLFRFLLQLFCSSLIFFCKKKEIRALLKQLETNQSKIVFHLKVLVAIILESFFAAFFVFFHLFFHFQTDSENADTFYQCNGLELLVSLYLSSPPADVVVYCYLSS
jgi:hypothetical protein